MFDWPLMPEGAALPAPPVPPDADLRHYPDMPLEVRRLRDSGIAKCRDAEAFRCAILLTCAAWCRRPAGSLPADNERLRVLAGLGRDQRTWSKVRDFALEEWVRHSDGRLYHPAVTAAVLTVLKYRRQLSKATRRAIYERDGGRCAYCKTPISLSDAAIDHVFPLARGGSSEGHNLALACRPCNSSKHARTPEEWRGEPLQ